MSFNPVYYDHFKLFLIRCPFIIILFLFHHYSAFAKIEANNFIEKSSLTKSNFPNLNDPIICRPEYVVLYIQNNNIINAFDDRVIAVMNNQVVFNVLDNDNLEKKDVGIGLINLPQNGKVEINEDHSLSYLPFQNICEEQDMFSYFVATEEGFDTAIVYVEILCEPLTIITGFAPERQKEGEQETFTILGVENFPNNQLSIFDKWGKEVYHKLGYRNEWDGKVDEEMISTGTYYYIFADGRGKVYSGYLSIEMEI